MRRPLASLVCLSCLILGSAGSAPGQTHLERTCPQKETVPFNPSSCHHQCPRPIDSSSILETRHPWTHKPRCIRHGAGDTSGYCTFTSSYFGNHGITLVTKPQIASAAVPDLCSIYHSSFPSPSTVRDLDPGPAAFGVRDIPGKGKGLVATTLIRDRETFLVDYASVVVHADFPKSAGEGDRLELQGVAVDQLANPEAVRALGRTEYSGDEIDDVLQTNTFTTPFEGESHHILYPLVSRINHACKPNAFMRYSSSGLVTGIAAFRDIQPGEEITISYIELDQASNARQQRLRHRWGFTCTCSLCTSPPSALARSDALRASIAKHKTAAIESLQSADLPRAIAQLQEVVDNLLEEGLVSLVHDPYEALATVHWVLGEKEEAMRYLNKMLDAKDDYGPLEPGDRAEALRQALKRLNGT